VTKYNSSDVGFLLLGPYDLTNVSSKLEDSVESPVSETTPFGVSNAQFEKPGMRKYGIDGHEGWYDDAAYSVNAALVALANQQNIMMFAPFGNVAGRICIAAAGALTTDFKRQFSVGDFHKCAMGLAINGAKDDAMLVKPLGVVTGTGNNEVLDVDYRGVQPAGTTGGTMYLSCGSIVWNGATALQIDVEHSNDGISYSVHTSFTAITSGGSPNGYTAEAKTMAGTINRYLAVKWTFTGGASPTANFAVAVKVN
jgi:hypothetical protein